ncbi:MFS transporter [Iamia majanohamensis]|uniref:MFS transporter n=1 Tax=Iamia majanohamensis TaxID=467976 RepID=A0AAE9Y9C8_9ACTN|nr:MFS transporter [Iamia majanohamensis]WCO66973.1 MFS transporter [Iamia majanohamensis]
MAVSEPPGALRLARPFLAVGMARFCVQLDFFSLNLALPTIARDLGSSVTDLQWLLSGYLLALGSLLVPAARAADVVGRRVVLLVGIAVFGTTSLVCGLVSSVPVLIAARVVQGVGAAMIMPTAFALVTNATGEDERPRIMGILIGLAGLGTALGPVVGGVLAGTLGWRWVFLVNVPIAVGAFLGVRRMAESRDATGPRSLAGLDRWGVVTVVGGLALVSLAIDDVSSQGWTSPATVGPLLGGVVLLALFARNETRVAHPLVRPSLLRHGPYTVLLVAGALANVGADVFVLAATLDLQTLRDLSAGEAGLLFFVASASMAVCGPLSGWLARRMPAARVMGLSLTLSAPVLVLLGLVTPLPLYVVVMCLCGFTTSIGYSLAQLAVQTVLPAARSAEGTSVLLTALVTLGGLGVVVATAVIEAVGDQQVTEDGLLAALAGVAALLLVAGLVTLARAPRPGDPAPAGS